MLSFAGAHADIVGVNPRLPSSEARDAAAGRAARQHRSEALLGPGGRRREVRRPVIHAWLASRRHNAAHDAAEPLTAVFKADVAEVLATPIVLLGDIEEIVERLHARYERWRYSYFTIQQTSAREFAPVVARLASTELHPQLTRPSVSATTSALAPSSRARADRDARRRRPRRWRHRHRPGRRGGGHGCPSLSATTMPARNASPLPTG